MRATTCGSSEAAIASSAAVAAPAASFQPANAQISAGERSSGGSLSQITGSTARAYPEIRLRPERDRPRSRSPSGRGGCGGDPATRGRSPGSQSCEPGQRFEGRYACVRKDRLTARNGGAYLAIDLRDRTGTLAARVFREADRIGLRFDSGDAVLVGGRLERYRGQPVAELDDVRRLEPGSFDPVEFLPSAYRSVEELEGFLEHLTREIHDPGLRGTVERLILSGPAAREFRRAPCTRAGHHAYLGWPAGAHRVRRAPWSAISASSIRGWTPTC